LLLSSPREEYSKGGLKPINQESAGNPKRQTKGLSKKAFSFRCFSFGRKRKADGGLGGKTPSNYKNNFLLLYFIYNNRFFV